MIVVAVDWVQSLHRPLGTKISAAGAQVVVVQMPNHRWPRVVEHPLNDASRLIFVAAVSFIHRAYAFIRLHLRLGREIFYALRFSVPVRQRLAEYSDGFELSASGVKVPNVVDRPQMIFANHGADTLDRRNGRSHARLHIEAIRAAAPSGIAQLAPRLALGRVYFPITRRNVFVRAAHFDAAVAGDAGLFSRSRRKYRIRPQQFFFDVEIHSFDIRRRRVVAAIQPHHQAGMAAQSVNLIAQRLFRDFEILRLPARPALPEVAAAPARQYQNSLMVGEVEEFLCFELAFESYGVQAHIAHVAEFVVQSLRVLTQHHVRCPAGAANQNVLAVDVEGAPTDGIEVGCDFADAELTVRAIAYRAVDLKLHGERIKIRLPHLRRPPQARIRKDKLRKRIGSECDVFRFVRSKFDFLLELHLFNLPLQLAFYRLRGTVLQLRRDGEARLIVGWRVQLRNDRGITQRHRPTGCEIHVAPESHVLIGRRGIPVDECDGQIVFRRRENLHSQYIFRARLD